MLHTKAAGRAPSIVVGSPSLGTTPRKIDLARGPFVSSLAICRVSISVVVDDVAALVDFQHRLELGVDDDVHGVQQRVAEMQFYAQVALLYQMEAGTVALVGGQVETEEGVAVSVVAASQSVPLVLPHLAGRGEQTHVAPDEEVVCEIGLERFGGYLSSVHVHLHSTDRIGYLTVLFSRALMCTICTVGFRVAFFANKVALTICIL